jgi:transposase
VGELNPSDLTKDELLSRYLQLQDRVEKFKQESDEKDEKIKLLQELVQQKNEEIGLKDEQIELKDEKIELLEAHLQQYENPHTPPSKQRSATDESPTSQDDEDNEDEDGDDNEDDVRTDGGTPGRKPGHDPASRETPEPDREVEVTCDCCSACGEDFDESEGVSPRLVEEIPDPQPPETTQYNRHHYECDSCGTQTVASHSDCPDEGQFGVNVIAQATLSKYEHRLPHRKIADRFEQLHGLKLSPASAWRATERAARAGRCEYEQIRSQIKQADVVHIDETGHKLDGEQIWIWTFRTDQHTLYAVRESRGSAVPEEILGEDFDGTIVCDGWTAYPAFSRKLQRCWAHILREAEYVADDHEEAVSIHRTLKQMYVGLQSGWRPTHPRTSEHRCRKWLKRASKPLLTDQ